MNDAAEAAKSAKELAANAAKNDGETEGSRP